MRQDSYHLHGQLPRRCHFRRPHHEPSGTDQLHRPERWTEVLRNSAEPRRLLKTALLFLLVGACTGSTEEPPQTVKPEFVPVYFFAGHALNAEYTPVEGTDPEQAIFDAITSGPQREDLKNFVPSETVLEAVGEAEEKLKLTLSEHFWNLPVGERYAAAAQVTFTMAVLEEGKEVFLLDDVVPGAIIDGDGRELPQPLSREDFSDVRPWAEVQQPAAGAILSGKLVPVIAEVRGRASVALTDAQGIGLEIPMRAGMATLRLPKFTGGQGTVEAAVNIVVTEGGERYVTEVPVMLLLEPPPGNSS